MKVKDIAACIEEFAPLSLQEEWDNSGLSIGSPEDEVRAVLVGFDCTPELIDEAVETGADMVITHHPLIFRGLKKIDGNDPVTRAVIKAIRSGVAVYAAHTNADKVPDGVSGAMASRLGLLDTCILDEDGDGTGLGIVGNLPEALPAGEAVKMVKEKFGLDHARCSLPCSSPVKRIAVCGGSGSSLIGAAVKSGAQLYVTGDVSYHNYFIDGDFMIMDIGHFESEMDVVDILFSLIRKKFPNFAVFKSRHLRENCTVRCI